MISHIEKLIEECLDESFGKSGIKQEVKNAINSKLDKVTGANIGRCHILAITNIVFARTDAFNDEIDKKFLLEIIYCTMEYINIVIAKSRKCILYCCHLLRIF